MQKQAGNQLDIDHEFKQQESSMLVRSENCSRAEACKANTWYSVVRQRQQIELAIIQF